jgi:hypothetical protein
VLFFCGRVHCRADALGLSGWQCGTTLRTVECEQTRVPAVFTLLLHLSLPDVRAHAFGCERPANKSLDSGSDQFGRVSRFLARILEWREAQLVEGIYSTRS